MPYIHREVQALQPLPLVQVVALAKLQEDKINDAKRPSHPRHPSFPFVAPPITLVPPPPPLLPCHHKPLLKGSLHPKWPPAVERACVTTVMIATGPITSLEPNSFFSSHLTNPSQMNPFHLTPQSLFSRNSSQRIPQPCILLSWAYMRWPDIPSRPSCESQFPSRVTKLSSLSTEGVRTILFRIVYPVSFSWRPSPLSSYA